MLLGWTKNTRNKCNEISRKGKIVFVHLKLKLNKTKMLNYIQIFVYLLFNSELNTKQIHFGTQTCFS